MPRNMNQPMTLTDNPTTAQPMRSMCFSSVDSNRTPAYFTSAATRKKRAPRQTSDAMKNPGTVNAATPAAIVNTL